MGDSQGVIRTNISVPRELKARMDAVQERVNWSAVATEAFQAKLRELESMKEVRGMDDVIERLKAAEEVDQNETQQAGFKEGAAWARKQARPRQLRLLKEIADDAYGLESHYAIFDSANNPDLARSLFQKLNPTQTDFDRADVEAFWERILDSGGADRINDYHFALGFISGAMDVWEKVKDRL
jgi:hypothetical protein